MSISSKLVTKSHLIVSETIAGSLPSYEFCLDIAIRRAATHLTGVNGPRFFITSLRYSNSLSKTSACFYASFGSHFRQQGKLGPWYAADRGFHDRLRVVGMLLETT
jgi:hypothetical protein